MRFASRPDKRSGSYSGIYEYFYSLICVLRYISSQGFHLFPFRNDIRQVRECLIIKLQKELINVLRTSWAVRTLLEEKDNFFRLFNWTTHQVCFFYLSVSPLKDVLRMNDFTKIVDVLLLIVQGKFIIFMQSYMFNYRTSSTDIY